MVQVHLYFGSVVSWSYFRHQCPHPLREKLNSLQYLLCSDLHIVKLI